MISPFLLQSPELENLLLSSHLKSPVYLHFTSLQFTSTCSDILTSLLSALPHLLTSLVLNLLLAILDGIACNLLVISLKSSKILTGLGELALLHTLTDVPVDEGTLGVHEIELVRKSGPSLTNSSGVGEHAAVEKEKKLARDIKEYEEWHRGERKNVIRTQLARP